MHFTKEAVLLLAGAVATIALPLEESKSTLHTLLRRGVSYDPSCNRQITGSNKLYKDKVQTAFADAGTLAQWTQQGTDSEGNAFTESTAFTHYFGDGDKDQVKQMMQAIYNSRIPDDDRHQQGYTITIKCGSDQDKNDCGTSVLAATSPKPDDSTMVLCDRFFSANTVQTRQDLSTKAIGSRRGQWCQTDEQFPFFEVAGLTMFHEMTHLDVVGSSAGLSSRPDPDGFSSHGTVDIYVQGTENDRNHYRNMEPWQAARELHQLWNTYNGDNSKYKPTNLTTVNAESYAAAALEFYFLANCKWDVILPK